MNIEQNKSYLLITNNPNNTNNNPNNTNNNKNIILFDLDNTIIKFKDFYQDNFEYTFSNIISKLQSQKNKQIIIISNQLNLLKNKKRYDCWINKITKLCEDFTKNNISIQIYASLLDDVNRKPRPGLYNEIKHKYSSKIEFYCADALGRHGDFSDTDLKFGLNCNLKIISPEEFFQNSPIQNKSISYPKLNIVPKNLLQNIPLYLNEMLIMVGMPASGKSYCAEFIQNWGFTKGVHHEIINRDKLKTIDKCIKKTKEALKLKVNLIIDNTNPSALDRKKFIDLGRKYSYKITVILFELPFELIKHNNYYRYFHKNGQYIPNVAYNIFKSRYEKPKYSEHIDRIIEIDSIVNEDLHYLKYYF